MGEVDGSLAAVGGTRIGVQQALAEREGWRLGSRVRLGAALGGRTGEVVALFERDVDDEVPIGPVLLARDALARFASASADIGVYAGQTSAAAVRARLARVLAGDPTVEVVDRAGYVRSQEGDFPRIVTAVYALLALIVLVALLGIANALSLSVTSRRRELALLSAVGLLPAQLRRMLRREALAACAVGAVAGMVVGGAVAAVGVPLLGRDAGLRLDVPVLRLLVLAALAAGASGLLALPTIARTRRISPTDAAGA